MNRCILRKQFYLLILFVSTAHYYQQRQKGNTSTCRIYEKVEEEKEDNRHDPLSTGEKL